MQSSKTSRSRRIPSSKGSVSATSTHSRHASGARWPRALRARRSRVASKIPGSSSTGVRSRASGCGGPAATRSSAKATAPRSRSPSITRSRMPCSAASSAGTRVPSTIMASATETFATRGRRWVPPAPGGKPSATSGCPTPVSRLADAIVAGKRHLEPTAEAVAGERGDDRLGRALDGGDDIAQGRLVHGPGPAEHADVGAGQRAPAAAAQHDRLDRIVGLGLLQPAQDRAGHAHAHRVHRRIVDGDDADRAVAFQTRAAHVSRPSVVIGNTCGRLIGKLADKLWINRGKQMENADRALRPRTPRRAGGA